MIKVCDAIMGTGKSSAAITYMNEHSNERFIYITPYLDEADRIVTSCPKMRFVQPSDKIRKYNFSKCTHTAALIQEGLNIATTHSAFKRYTQEMLDDIKRYGYHLIIDENMEILERYDVHNDDVQMAIDAGYVEYQDDALVLKNTEYSGKAFREMFDFLRSRDLIQLNGVEGTHLYYWMLPPLLIQSFSEVIILTYLFDGQGLHHFLQLTGLEYEYIGIELGDDGKFRFGEAPGYTPSYVSHLKDMLHIISSKTVDKESEFGTDKYNSIGDDYYALSMSWFGKEDDDGETNLEKIKEIISNLSKNVWKSADADEKLIGVFKSNENALRGKGYSKALITFNLRATNKYKNRKYLMYMTNLFMNVGEKLFYQKHGIEVDEDMYALSIMVQWIWRSAIRDGEEVYLYIPSRRMRKILTDWIENTSKGGAADE